MKKSSKNLNKQQKRTWKSIQLRKRNFRPRNQECFKKIKEENKDKNKKKEKDIAKIGIKSNEEQKLLENFKIVTRQFL